MVKVYNIFENQNKTKINTKNVGQNLFIKL